MNLINDLIIGGLIFLIIVLFRSTIRNHRGVITGGFLIIIAGYLTLSIDQIYAWIIMIGGAILIMIGIAERHEKIEEE
jgi:hypothetical protein